jgi:hypothetical protein
VYLRRAWGYPIAALPQLTVDAVARTVCEVETNLKDAFEAAVILEALGYSDRDAKAFGYRDLFGFAGAITEVATVYGWTDPLAESGSARPRPISAFSGVFGNLAWMLLLITLFAGGHSLWAARDFGPDIGAAAGLGVVLGLAVSGGLQQFASWKISYYHLQNNRPLVRFVVGRTLLIGTASLALTSFVAFAIAARGFPTNIALLSAAYALLVGGYRLTTAPLLGMNRFGALLGVTIFGLVGMFASYAAFTDLGADRLTAVFLSQLVGVGLICGASALTLAIGIRRPRAARPRSDILAVRSEDLRKIRPPRFWVLLFECIPQLVFGTLFFFFLFTDRLVLWLGPNASDPRSHIAYQIGIDTALLVLIPIGVVQLPLIRRLSEQLEDIALRTPLTGASAFAGSIRDLYSGLSLRMVAAALTVCGLAFLFSEEIVGLAGGDRSSVPVFDVGLLGIFFFSVFLTNSAFAMTFRRTAQMSVLLLVAFMVNVILSATASSIGTYAVVLGFVLSSFLLAVASLVDITRIIDSADHAYYAAA